MFFLFQLRQPKRNTSIETLLEVYCEEYFPGILQGSQGKMAIILFLLLNPLLYGTSAVSIMPELKQNVLRFGYGVNLDMKVCWHIHLIDFMW